MHAPPKLLVSTAPFFRQPLREAFRAVAESGYRSVEVMVTQDPATQEPHLLAGLAGEFDLAVEAIHAPFLLMTRRVWGTEPTGKIYRAVRLAEEVGASLVVIHPPYRWQVRFRRWIERSLAEFSARTGVMVAVENMFPVRLGGERGGLTFHAGQQIEDLERYPYLVLDTSHAAVSGLDILDFFRRYQEKILHVHLSNNAGKGWDSHLPVYEGVLPTKDFLDLVRGSGFAGTVSLELDLRPYLRDEKLTREVLVRNREFCEAHLALAPDPGR
ncbi:MAG: sugar phosphate isomerase/epimerase [Actinobacteria bacterium]|nr:sugar phosphate isomerase/epimerase [Actinomycetota bacterium]